MTEIMDIILIFVMLPQENV